MAHDREYFRTLALSATRGVSVDQLEAIADVCMEAEAAGKPTSIWHAFSAVFGTLDICPCFPCSKARGEG